MSTAVCTECEKEYPWSARRGVRLSDIPSPCCHARGKAVQRSPRKPISVKHCPECGKAGLQWKKQLRNHESPPLKDGHFDWGAMYCPRCKKWVTPIRK